MSRWQKIGKYVTVKNYTVYFSAKADNGLLAGEIYGKKNKELSCIQNMSFLFCREQINLHGSV